MSVKLIAENILVPSDFSSATQQEGEYIGQPIPSSANTGDFRPLTAGDIEDFSYNGTATGNGVVGGTTVVDSVLAVFGDDYFIGGSIEITSGVCNGEEQAVTDFAQTTGTLTTAAFTAQIVIGVTFVLTVSFATRDFDVTLVAAGDAGTATFKWSHDGGTTWLGRDNPTQADWLGETEVHGNSPTQYQRMTEAADGSLVVLFNNGNDAGYISSIKSTEICFPTNSFLKVLT